MALLVLAITSTISVTAWGPGPMARFALAYMKCDDRLFDSM